MPNKRLWTPYVRLKQFNVTYGVPPKNGSSSFYEALRRCYGLPRTKHFKMVQNNPHLFEQVDFLDHPGFFVVRHPIDRFESLWRSKCRDNHGTVGGHPIRGMNPYDLFAYIKQHDDPHWRPQIDMIKLGEMPNITLVPLDEFTHHFKAHTGLDLWYQNPTKELKSDYFDLGLLSEVADYYADDVDLYEKALANRSRI